MTFSPSPSPSTLPLPISFFSPTFQLPLRWHLHNARFSCPAHTLHPPPPYSNLATGEFSLGLLPVPSPADVCGWPFAPCGRSKNLLHDMYQRVKGLLGGTLQSYEVIPPLFPPDALSLSHPPHACTPQRVPPLPCTACCAPLPCCAVAALAVEKGVLVFKQLLPPPPNPNPNPNPISLFFSPRAAGPAGPLHEYDGGGDAQRNAASPAARWQRHHPRTYARLAGTISRLPPLDLLPDTRFARTQCKRLLAHCATHKAHNAQQHRHTLSNTQSTKRTQHTIHNAHDRTPTYTNDRKPTHKRTLSPAYACSGSLSDLGHGLETDRRVVLCHLLWHRRALRACGAGQWATDQSSGLNG